MNTNVRALTALGDVICRAQTTNRTPMGIAFAIDAAGLVMSPEIAAELAEYRRQFPLLMGRVAELEAERHTTNEALAKVTVALRAAERRARPARVVSKRSRETPSTCRHCGIGQREHFQQWTAAAGWHSWVVPTTEQIKSRMWARRIARAVDGASC